MATDQNTTIDRHHTVEYAVEGFVRNIDQVKELALARVQDMDLKQLRALFEACETLSSVMSAFTCQPRFHAGHEGLGALFNPAGEIIQTIDDSLGWLATLAANTAAAKKPDSAEDCEIKGTILVANVSREDDFPKIAAVALQAARDLAAAGAPAN